MEQLISQEHKDILFQKTYIKALLDNKNNLSQWKEYKEKYEEVIKNLKYYVEKHQHSIFLPVGNKAYVKGKLVHTNDVWITLGCGYFLKTGSKKTIEICERRIQTANALIEKWEKEQKLLENMREFPLVKGAFASEGSKEIVETFIEDKEEQWQKEHREKEIKYRQQLKQVKEQTSATSITTEKDIWEHLEALELQEELEDELNRLGCETDSSSDDDDEEEEESVEENHSEVSIIDSKGVSDNNLEVREKKQSSLRKNPSSTINSKKTVSFNLPAEDVKKESFSAQQNKIKETEVIPNAVSDLVYENVPKPSIIIDINEPKRPMSKFRMNRKEAT